MHYEILDENRKSVLGKLSVFKDRFYLAGGTALAFHFGHRQSIDFDFFSKEVFDENKLISELEKVFVSDDLKVIQLESGTVTVLVKQEVKISFFNYKYELLKPAIKDSYFSLASVVDISCMKLSAICSRATNKDYVDLYFILKESPLRDLMTYCNKKFPSLDKNVILKSLVYYEDIDFEPLIMILERDLDFKDVQSFLEEKLTEYYK